MVEAIEEYHRALAVRPGDAFAMEMLSVALVDACPYQDDMGLSLP